jgi:hypothetical protein
VLVVINIRISLNEVEVKIKNREIKKEFYQRKSLFALTKTAAEIPMQ